MCTQAPPTLSSVTFVYEPCAASCNSGHDKVAKTEKGLLILLPRVCGDPHVHTSLSQSHKLGVVAQTLPKE